MGNTASPTILLLGLDNSGKSTLLQMLSTYSSLAPMKMCAPTWHPNIDNVNLRHPTLLPMGCKPVKITFIDVNGSAPAMRRLWHHFIQPSKVQQAQQQQTHTSWQQQVIKLAYENAAVLQRQRCGIIFIVDVVDTGRFDESHECLENVLASVQAKCSSLKDTKVPILILFNKYDRWDISKHSLPITVNEAMSRLKLDVLASKFELFTFHATMCSLAKRSGFQHGIAWLLGEMQRQRISGNETQSVFLIAVVVFVAITLCSILYILFTKQTTG